MRVENKRLGMERFMCFTALYFVCQVFCSKSLKFGTSIAFVDPVTVQLPPFSILSAMFTGSCGPPEKLNLPFVLRSNILRMIVLYHCTLWSAITLSLSPEIYHRVWRTWHLIACSVSIGSYVIYLIRLLSVQCSTAVIQLSWVTSRITHSNFQMYSVIVQYETGFFQQVWGN